MELREFIKSSLVEISRGILDASKELEDTNAVVSPNDFKFTSESSQAFGRTFKSNVIDPTSGTRVVHKVDFDIAVVVDETDTAKAGVKISVMSIGLSAGGESSSKSGSTSRIKFSVPIVLPSKEA
nr:trypco2 family protein [uncultured Desulfobacter sp.]